VTLLLEPPTDAQLGFIRKLCTEQGWQFPDAVASKTEASLIIDEMRASTYRPEKYAVPFPEEDNVPF
jgi:hypothetical protein